MPLFSCEAASRGSGRAPLAIGADAETPGIVRPHARTRALAQIKLGHSTFKATCTRWPPSPCSRPSGMYLKHHRHVIPRLPGGGIFGTYPPSTTCLRGRKRCSRAPPVAAEPPVRPPPGGRAFRCRNPAKSGRSAVVEPREAASHEKSGKGVLESGASSVKKWQPTGDQISRSGPSQREPSIA